ncbi:hypothetical protein [Treponema primitia]|uniref:hypothetical protein n=1 Tax=Treponema primitia TaxID=88058 RepID=UPI001FE1F0D3|nr:hypothetical protein [Treponema primitia]
MSITDEKVSTHGHTRHDHDHTDHHDHRHDHDGHHHGSSDCCCCTAHGVSQDHIRDKYPLPKKRFIGGALVLWAAGFALMHLVPVSGPELTEFCVTRRM